MGRGFVNFFGSGVLDGMGHVMSRLEPKHELHCIWLHTQLAWLWYLWIIDGWMNGLVVSVGVSLSEGDDG